MAESIYRQPGIYRDLVISTIPIIESLVPTQKADDVARSIAEQFCKKFEGNRYIVPSLSRAEKLARDEKIIMQAQSNTTSVKQLAKDHGLSERTIKRTLKESDLRFDWDFKCWVRDGDE